MSKTNDVARQQAIERLREWLKPGDTVWTQIRNVSRSGMSRVIQVVKIEKSEPSWLGYNVAQALGWSYDRQREGVKVTGCGMDMGFHLVYELCSVLWPDGYSCTGKSCQSSFHQGANYDVREVGQIHKDGYGLKQRWL